ncbi:hypothetical protein GS597_07475 [Synechococcales cyanobacterium C]|uniref:Uncharacterized protein n=1 Tax=Petrachloros mirabilis ULC683 TaxID=2781853 RepID=A0A8K1ZZ48_9CYAN|nr:hypothetical protein [Petrachloros mirabilis]NCJ06352.1 hypothetical protein [Petrachloros mirabilis ULC683]
MPKGNPNPVAPPKFVAARFKPQGVVDEPLADVAVQVRLTESIDALVRSLPNRSAWLRRVITEAAERELTGKEGEA